MFVETAECSHIVGENVKGCKHCGKRSGSSFMKLNKSLPQDPEILLFSIYLREVKTCVYQKDLYKNIHISFIAKSLN